MNCTPRVTAVEAYRTANTQGNLAEEQAVGHQLRITSLLEAMPKMLAVPKIEQPDVHSNVAWTEDGRLAVVGRSKRRVTVFDAKNWDVTHTVAYPTDQDITHIAVNIYYFSIC